MFLLNILKDENFIEWLKSRRSKKEIDSEIFGIVNNKSNDNSKDDANV